MAYVFIIFVGFHKDRLMTSIKWWMKRYPPEKFLLVTGQQETSGEPIAGRVAEELREALSTPLYSVTIERIDKLNVTDAVMQLMQLLLPEKAAGNDILLDISGSLRIFSVVAYIVACLTQSKLVSVIPKYDMEGNELQGEVDAYLEMPILPQSPISAEQTKILATIGPGMDSVENLVRTLYPETRANSKQYNTERSRVSYYLEILEKAGFLNRTKEGKTVRIELTDLGKIYAEQTPNLESNLNLNRKRDEYYGSSKKV